MTSKIFTPIFILERWGYAWNKLIIKS